jgi:hypothetical protein
MIRSPNPEHPAAQRSSAFLGIAARVLTSTVRICLEARGVERCGTADSFFARES